MALGKSNLACKSIVNIFIDGPKNGQDKLKINEISLLQKNDYGFSKMNFFFSKVNQGLADSIINGIDSIMKTHESVIVIEDDLIVSEKFLLFCNDALIKFKNNEVVSSIIGYTPDFGEMLNEPYFLNRADCWGWATWRSRWELLERDAEVLVEKIERLNLEYDLDFYGTFPYLEMLKLEANGKIDSWAIRWQASMLINKKLSLYSPKSLILNLGFEGDGTHGTKTSAHDTILTQERVLIPEDLQPIESKLATELWMSHYREITRRSRFHVIYRIRLKISTINLLMKDIVAICLKRFKRDK